MSRNDAYPTNNYCVIVANVQRGVPLLLLRFAVAAFVYDIIAQQPNNIVTIIPTTRYYHCPVLLRKKTHRYCDTHHCTIQFEPVFNSKRSKNILQHIILYECQGSSEHLQAMSRDSGRSCYGRPSLPCNAIVAAWFRGSEVRFHIL